jgi:hypothetical protein
VTLAEHGGRTTVTVVDPEPMLGMMPGNPELAALATEAESALRRVAASLRSAA